MEYPLVTERLSIWPLGLHDLEVFVGYRQDPEVARYQSWSPDYSQTQAGQLIEGQENQTFPVPGDWLQLGIHLLGSTQLIGDLALHNVEGELGCFEIGFTLASSFQGMGYAREAASALVINLEQKHDAQRLIASTDARNLASISLLNQLGFAHDPNRDWEEFFKGEDVKVLFFEKLISNS